MKSFSRTALINGAAFGIPTGIFVGIAFGIVRGLSVGVLVGLVIAVACGLPFGLAMAGFMAIQRRRFAQVCSEFAGEGLLHNGPANHFFKREAVGGWLFLTRERLLFRSHRFNAQCHEFSVPLGEIAEVRAVRSAMIIPNGLRLVTRSGGDERFVVEAHRRWCDEIISAQARVA